MQGAGGDRSSVRLDVRVRLRHGGRRRDDGGAGGESERDGGDRCGDANADVVTGCAWVLLMVCGVLVTPTAAYDSRPGVPPGGAKSGYRRPRRWRSPCTKVASARAVEDAELLGPACRLEPRVHVQLFVDVRDVRADGLLADEQPASDLAVGQPVGEEPQDLLLPARQPGRAAVSVGGLLGRRCELQACAPGETRDVRSQRCRAEGRAPSGRRRRATAPPRDARRSASSASAWRS